MKKSILISIVVLSFCVYSYSQPDNEYQSAVKELIKVSGSEKAYDIVIVQILDIFKQQDNGVPMDAWELLEEEFLGEARNGLADLLAPVYYKHLTLSDLKGVISFYKTPVGQKFAEKTPQITQDAMIAGQKWGEQLGKNVVKKIEELGY